MARGRRGAGFDAEEMIEGVLDDLLPERLDWRRLVLTYPVPALLVAAAGGYLLGRRHGPAVLAAIPALAMSEVSRRFDPAADPEAG